MSVHQFFPNINTAEGKSIGKSVLMVSGLKNERSTLQSKLKTKIA